MRGPFYRSDTSPSIGEGGENKTANDNAVDNLTKMNLSKAKLVYSWSVDVNNLVGRAAETVGEDCVYAGATDVL